MSVSSSNHALHVPTNQNSLSDPNSSKISIDPKVVDKVYDIMSSLKANSLSQPSSVKLGMHAESIPINKSMVFAVNGNFNLSYPRNHEYKWKQYIGECKEGKFHGKGKLYFWEGAIKEGDWKDGCLNGKAVYITSNRNGDVYEGEWKDGLLHGYGKFINALGESYEGFWENGKKHGLGTYIDSESNIYIGKWVNNLKEGPGKQENHKNKCFAEGIFKQDELYEGLFKKLTTCSRSGENLNYMVGAFESEVHEGIESKFRKQFFYYDYNYPNIWCMKYEGEVEDSIPHGEGEKIHIEGNIKKIQKGRFESKYGVGFFRSGTIQRYENNTLTYHEEGDFFDYTLLDGIRKENGKTIVVKNQKPVKNCLECDCIIS